MNPTVFLRDEDDNIVIEGAPFAEDEEPDTIVIEAPIPVSLPDPITILPRRRRPTAPGIAPVKAGETEFFDPPTAGCPMCGHFALCKLPPIFAATLGDGTEFVCHTYYGGCNRGFKLATP